LPEKTLLHASHRQRDILHALLQRVQADQVWWQNEGQKRIDALRTQKEELDASLMCIFTKLAEKAADEILAAIRKQDIALRERMLAVMAAAASPFSQYRTVWATLLQNLHDEKGARRLVAKNLPIYFFLLKIWTSIEPPLESSTPLGAWLPRSWPEFSVFLDLQLSDEWNVQAAMALSRSKSFEEELFPEVLRKLEKNSHSIERLFRRLLLSDQPDHDRLSAWLLERLIKSEYRGTKAVISLLFELRTISQSSVEHFLAATKFTEEEQSTHCCLLLMDSSRSSIERKFLKSLTMKMSLIYIWTVANLYSNRRSDIEP
jgi:hypothetical protein